ncbi:MAG: patatin-like phospholipase family protein [Myxococcaceae bacterium]
MKTLRELLQGKRFGLVLSAGYFGFYGHTGFWKGLENAGLEPSAYAGTSAGGLVSAFAASGAQVATLEALLRAQKRDGFWDPDPLGAVVNAARGGHFATGLLKGERFRTLLSTHLPVKRFEDCKKPLLVVAANLTHGSTSVFTQGELAPRVHATCAYPGLFRAVEIDGELYWDGGLVDKAPALALSDSVAGKGLEALLVHYLPSRNEGSLTGAMAYARGLSAGMAAIRRDHFRLQLEVLKARGVPTYVVVSELPPVSPKELHRGPEALKAATLSAEAALSAPPREFSVEGI